MYSQGHHSSVELRCYLFNCITGSCHRAETLIIVSCGPICSGEVEMGPVCNGTDELDAIVPPPAGAQSYQSFNDQTANKTNEAYHCRYPLFPNSRRLIPNSKKLLF